VLLALSFLFFLPSAGCTLVDVQVVTPHLVSTLLNSVPEVYAPSYAFP
jgi:hypothetical protein